MDIYNFAIVAHVDHGKTTLVDALLKASDSFNEHKGLTEKCWQISKLKKFKNLPIVLETMNLSIEELKENIQLAKNAILP